MSYLALWDPMDYRMPGSCNLHYLLEFAQIHVHWVSNVIWHLIFCHPFLLLPSILPSIMVFSNQLALSISVLRVSVSASVLPMNIQCWFPLGLTGLISLQSKGLSKVFSSTTIRKHEYFGAKPSLLEVISNKHFV